MESWLQENNFKIYSNHNEGKPVVAETFIKTFKHKIYKYMISILDNNNYPKYNNIFTKGYTPNWS